MSHKRTRTGTILVVADVLRPLAPPVVYTGTGCKQRCFWAVSGGSGNVGVGVHFTCQFPSTFFFPYDLCSVLRTEWKEKCGAIQFELMARNYTFVYIYITKELNVETLISSRSSFRSVPFEKKESLKKKKKGIVTFTFRSWMPGYNYLNSLNTFSSAEPLFLLKQGGVLNLRCNPARDKLCDWSSLVMWYDHRPNSRIDGQRRYIHGLVECEKLPTDFLDKKNKQARFNKNPKIV